MSCVNPHAAGDGVTSVGIHVRDVFLAALMLTGNFEAAEKAVSEAIATSGCSFAMEELLVETAKRALQIGDECALPAEMPSSLPPELQRLFLLSSVGRKCFVLRILMGLTAEVSSGILDLQRDEVNEVLCDALNDLPRLDPTAHLRLADGLRAQADDDFGVDKQSKEK